MQIAQQDFLRGMKVAGAQRATPVPASRPQPHSCRHTRFRAQQAFNAGRDAASVELVRAWQTMTGKV
jgi:hypothetical protein